MWTRSSCPHGGSQQTLRAGLADHGEALPLCARWARALLQAGPRVARPFLSILPQPDGKAEQGLPLLRSQVPSGGPAPRLVCSFCPRPLASRGTPAPRAQEAAWRQKQPVDVLFCAVPRSHSCLCACVDPVACRTL